MAPSFHDYTMMHTMIKLKMVWHAAVAVAAADQGKNCSQWLLELQQLHAQRKNLGSRA